MNKHCPYCGSSKMKFERKKAKTTLSKRYEGYKYRYTGSIRCNICCGRGPTVGIDVKGEGISRLELAELENMAYDAWNSRV